VQKTERFLFTVLFSFNKSILTGGYEAELFLALPHIPFINYFPVATFLH